MRIVVAVGGGIAAYKSVELVRELLRRHHQVRVAMTPSATRFVGPATFAGITGAHPVTGLWEEPGEVHVELGAWADAIVVAPATMSLLARAANGLADEAVTATLACARGPLLFAPAMHSRMWRNPATEENVRRLVERGARLIGPVEGPLASGDVGIGRMAEPVAIADAVDEMLGQCRDLPGVRLLVTAGPTYEDLDPVRFLGNRSSGKMGFALAERARDRGAEVTLVYGPVALAAPTGLDAIEVRSADEMLAAVTARAGAIDVVVMAAAVADYRPAERSIEKLKKGDGATATIELQKNPDILAELGAARADGRPVLVGFALETGDLVVRARAKLSAKRVDLVVANDAAVAFGGDENEALLVSASGWEALPRLSKHALADRILDRVRDLLGQRAQTP